MDHFELHSEYKPTGDQPQAIEKLVKGFKEGNQFETLLGVTGSGKTFTMANVIQALNKPTLILAHNKTLAAQLYGEFKEFFPENAVEYFVSYYDFTSQKHMCLLLTLILLRTLRSMMKLTSSVFLPLPPCQSEKMLLSSLLCPVSMDWVLLRNFRT